MGAVNARPSGIFALGTSSHAYLELDISGGEQPGAS
jgi:hypothetical protein